jgi:hypothetical protein
LKAGSTRPRITASFQQPASRALIRSRNSQTDLFS